MTDDIEQLLDYGRIGLETGQYEQAREDFEKVLALDPSNREAVEGLARANEILSRRVPTPVEPTRAEPVEPLRKVSLETIKPEVEPVQLAGKERSITGLILEKFRGFVDLWRAPERERLAAEEREERAREVAKRELVPTMPPVQPVAMSAADHRKMLDYLVELHEAGILSDAEFEKKKADVRLGASNQEITKGLVQVDEMLGSEMATAIEPIQDESVGPPHVVEQERTIPEKETKVQGKSPMWWVNVVILMGVLLMFVYYRYAEVPGLKESEKVDLLILSYEPKVTEWGIVVIVGRAKNVSGRQLSYAEVCAKFYDADGVLISSSLDNINDLGAGEVWHFEIMFLGEDIPARYKIYVGTTF